MIRDKDSALSRAKKTNKREDWDAAKQLRNRVGLAIQNMRRDYIEDERCANQGNPQKFWRNLKTVVPGKTKQTENIDLIKDGNAVLSNRTADELNNFLQIHRGKFWFVRWFVRWGK